jgi:hypothetical protein
VVEGPAKSSCGCDSTRGFPPSFLRLLLFLMVGSIRSQRRKYLGPFEESN